MHVAKWGNRLAVRLPAMALMVAAALRSGCNTLWSEDMHDGLIVDSRLRIANPFAAT